MEDEDFDDLNVFGFAQDDPMGNAEDTSEQHPKQDLGQADDEEDVYRDRCGSLLKNFSPTPN